MLNIQNIVQFKLDTKLVFFLVRFKFQIQLQNLKPRNCKQYKPKKKNLLMD